MFLLISPAVERTTDKDKTFKVSDSHLIIAVCHKSDQAVYVFAMKKTDVYDNHIPTVAQR